MGNAFTHHPAAIGETYPQHLRMAGRFATRMLVAALACYVHALFPFLFERTGSRAIADLHHRMSAAGRRVAANPPQPAPSPGSAPLA